MDERDSISTRRNAKHEKTVIHLGILHHIVAETAKLTGDTTNGALRWWRQTFSIYDVPDMFSCLCDLSAQRGGDGYFLG